MKRPLLERVRDFVDFFRVVDNWHKLPILRGLLCRIGRHDYELTEFTVIHPHPAEPPRYGALLTCFYCGQDKRSCPHASNDEA